MGIASITCGRICHRPASEMERCVERGERPERATMWIKYAAMFAMILTFGSHACCAQEPSGKGANSEETVPNESNAVKDKNNAPEATRLTVSIGKVKSKCVASDSVLEAISDRLRQYIVGARKFEVMDREHIKELLKMQMLAAGSMSGGEEAEAPVSGKIKTVSYVIYVTVLDCGVEKPGAKSSGGDLVAFKSRVEIEFKIINCNTGSILAEKTATGFGVDRVGAASGSKAPIGRGMRDAINEACRIAADAFRDLACPAKIVKVGNNDVTINMTDEEVQEGDAFDVIESDEPVVDQDTGAFLDFDGDTVGRIFVTRPGLQTSRATPAEGGKLDIKSLDTDKHTYLLRRVSKTTLMKEKRRRAMRSEAM